MMNGVIQSGYYGKLPLRGDFIQRNLDATFIQTWDGWLQSVIATSRETLGEHWLNYYLISPIWRFYLPPIENNAYCGIMLPSVDKVGRYFPFTITTPIEDSTGPEQIISSNLQWFTQAEQLALKALEESISFEQLNQFIDSFQLMPQSSASLNTTNNRNFRIPLSDLMTVERAFTELCHVLPSQQSQQFSYWWSNGNEHVAGNLLCCDTMPDDNLYTAMLDGQWDLCHVQALTDNNTPELNNFN